VTLGDVITNAPCSGGSIAMGGWMVARRSSVKNVLAARNAVQVFVSPEIAIGNP
jgi:hypothetical protein